MKIFYAIQGTGNGHLSRAEQLYPYLKKYGEVDFFLSGSNSQLTRVFQLSIKVRDLVCITNIPVGWIIPILQNQYLSNYTKMPRLCLLIITT